PFKRVFVQPAAGDDGGSLGAALYVYHQILGNKKRSFFQQHSYFGESFTSEEVQKFLKKNKIPYTKVPQKKLDRFVALEIIRGSVIGLFNGRAEWGPRALGSRSIIADPRNAKMKEIINTKIKFREPYRPFAPVVLSEKAADYFKVDELQHHNLTRFMLGV